MLYLQHHTVHIDDFDRGSLRGVVPGNPPCGVIDLQLTVAVDDGFFQDEPPVNILITTTVQTGLFRLVCV